MTLAAFRRPDLVVETKPDLTPVTEADRRVEEALRAELARYRAGDAIIGEEGGSTGSGRRRWIIDPIDGTKKFRARHPVWATLLALEVDGVLEVGVASAPALGRRWWAGRGLGAFAGAPGAPASAGAPIRVSAVAALGDAQLSYAGLAGWDAAGRVDGLIGAGPAVLALPGFR